MADATFPLPDPLTAPEQRLCDAATRGAPLAFDQNAPEAERLIRPAVIEALMRNHATRLTGRGLRVRWAVLAGSVDLAGLGAEEAPAPPLVLWGASGPSPEGEGVEPAGLDLDLTGAVLAELDLQDSRLARIEAPNLVLRRRLLLNRCRTEPGAGLTFEGARIGGNLLLRGATIEGAVHLNGAVVGGDLSANGPGTRLANRGGAALSCDRVRVGGGVFLRGAVFEGEVRLLGAEVGSDVSATGTLLANPGGAALSCDRARVAGSVVLDDAVAMGAVRLTGAEVGGQLAARRARLRNRDGDGDALICWGAIIRGGVSLEPAVIEGTANFAEAEVGRALYLAGSRIEDLYAEGLRLNGDLQLADATARAVCLDRACIQGALVLTGATLTPLPDDRGEQLALSLEQARVETRIEVNALPAATRGVFDLRGVHTGLLDDAGGRGWGEPCRPDQPALHKGKLQGVRLRLEGLTYARLSEFEDRAGQDTKVARRNRHAFLMRQFGSWLPGRDDFAPQSFDQVIAVARAAGHPRDADWFARQKRIFRRRCGVDGALGTIWSWFNGFFFGHYFLPGRALATLAGAVALGVLLLATANGQPRGPYADPGRPGDTVLLAKRREKVELPPQQAPAGARENRFDAEPCWETGGGDFVPLFTAFGLTVQAPARPGLIADMAATAFDLMLPVVELRMSDRCEINDDALGHESWSFFFAFYSVVGLIILPMFLATVTGLLKREGT